MATQRYYLSRDSGTCSPRLEELQHIEAESPAAAIARLAASGNLPRDWPIVWVHVLVWTGRNGQHRGFESARVRG